MAKSHTPAFKRKVIEYVREGESINSAAKKFKVSWGKVKKWLEESAPKITDAPEPAADIPVSPTEDLMGRLMNITQTEISYHMKELDRCTERMTKLREIWETEFPK